MHYRGEREREAKTTTKHHLILRHRHYRTTSFQAGKVIGDGGILSSVHDPENDRLTFNLLPSSEASGISVDEETAEFVFAADFVLTRRNSLLVVGRTVCVRDGGNLTACAKVKITIHHVNSRPRLLYLPSNITGKFCENRLLFGRLSFVCREMCVVRTRARVCVSVCLSVWFLVPR